MTFFLYNGGCDGAWIIDKIGEDIKESLENLGYACKIGGKDDYNGEAIVYHLFYNKSVPFKEAKHNSIFITHTDDKLKELDLIRIKDDYDSYITMSPEDAQFLVELGFDSSKVYGKNLPVRNKYVRPISIGIFSACYPDGRKNDGWLIDYCRNNSLAKLVNFVFIGKGWGKMCEELEKFGCSTEWHNVSRSLPYEYQYQQNMLAQLDYYMYMGMDGGAMGTYDAYAQGVSLFVTFDGFHKSIPYIDYSFDSKESFSSQLDAIISKHKAKLDYFKENTPANYVKWLMNVWSGKGDNQIPNAEKTCISYSSVLEKRRDNYFPISMKRIKGSLFRRYFKLANR